MSKNKLTVWQRRSLILRRLSGESLAELSHEYGIARANVWELTDTAVKNAEEKERLALEEWIFRLGVVAAKTKSQMKTGR